MIEAIFFDVDGTLLSFQTHVLTPATLEALHTLRRKGIRLFVSTGRHYAMLEELHQHFTFDGYITLSGQYVTVGDRVLAHQPLEREAVEELVSAVEQHGFSTIFLEGTDIYINAENEAARQFAQGLSVPMPPVRSPQYALGRTLYQAVTFLTREQEHLLLDQAPHLKATRWHPSFLDIIPPNGGKDKGMDAILDHFGIPVERTMAFGDGENDLSMLAHAGIGVAMGSASDLVKEAADWVTGTVDEDGVTAALAHFQLIP